MPTPPAGRSLRYSDEAIAAHWITPKAVTALAATISPNVTSHARQSILDIKVYVALHKPTRQALRSEPRFKKSATGLGLFCARTGVLQPSTGLVNRLHTTADKQLAAPESRYSHAELGLSRDEWLFLCVPGTANPYNGYGVQARTDELRRDSAVDVPAMSSAPAAADGDDETMEGMDDGYPDRWLCWLPADQSVTLTCPGCACELTGVVDHRGGVMGYGCSVCPFGDGHFEGEDLEEDSEEGRGVVCSVGGGEVSSVGDSVGEGPVFVRPSLLHHYWDEVVVDEKDSEEDMEEGYLKGAGLGRKLGFVLVRK